MLLQHEHMLLQHKHMLLQHKHMLLQHKHAAAAWVYAAAALPKKYQESFKLSQHNSTATGVGSDKVISWTTNHPTPLNF
jgi:hypothetical protein